MSDEGVVNVEDDGPPVQDVVASGTPGPADAGAVSPPADGLPPASDVPADHPAEVDAVEVGGQKYVPVGALISERRQRQAAEKEAAKVGELEAYARDSKPYVEFLKANPGLINRPQQSAQPAAPSSEVVDPVAEQLAKTLDLYTPEGKPDLARGGVMSGLVKSLAREMAQGIIAPMREESDQTKSARNFHTAMQIKDAQGRSPSQQALAQIWRTMPASQTADPNVASILALTALGLDSVSTKPAPLPPVNAPLVTEGQGGGPRRPTLSVLEQNIARDRGIKESQWAENTKGFTPGRATQLED